MRADTLKEMTLALYLPPNWQIVIHICFKLKTKFSGMYA